MGKKITNHLEIRKQASVLGISKEQIVLEKPDCFLK